MAIQKQERLRIVKNYLTSTSGPTATSTSSPVATATSGPTTTALTIPVAKTTAGTASTYKYTLLSKTTAAASVLGVIGSVFVFGVVVAGVGLLSYAVTKAALEP